MDLYLVQLAKPPLFNLLGAIFNIHQNWKLENYASQLLGALVMGLFLMCVEQEWIAEGSKFL